MRTVASSMHFGNLQLCHFRERRSVLANTTALALWVSAYTLWVQVHVNSVSDVGGQNQLGTHPVGTYWRTGLYIMITLLLLMKLQNKSTNP